MRHVFIIVLCTMFCLGSAAQDNIEPTDSVDNFDPVVTSSQLDAALGEITSLVKNITANTENDQPVKDVYVDLSKRKFMRSTYIYSTLDVCPTISTDKVTNEDKSATFLSNDDTEDTNSTQWGLNFGGSFVFVPGKIEDDRLRLNQFGFAYNIGFTAAFAKSSRYDTVCDFLLKAGLEIGNGHKFGFGFDALWGYGKSVGDVYFFKNIVEDESPSKVVPYTEWCWEKGGQIWMRTNLLNQTLPNTEMLVFARLMLSDNPKVMTEASSVHYNLWKRETWSFGVIFRYKM